ncbi:MAG: sugar nucleotide-binding protein [Candidatus Omnitrophota bacterium]|nr:sugar nucleotide-binding protein [Candidatus Omnitrophota bacterium]
MKNKILIVGKGYIGTHLAQTLQCPVSGQRISSFKDIQRLLDRYRPNTIINCIGHTGKRNVDDCELELDQTLSANTFVPILLAEAAWRKNIKFVHISSGCIYHYHYGKQEPIDEDRIPDYYDLYYSRTKIYAENVLTQMAKRCNILIARVRVPLDDAPHPKNLLTKLIRYQKIIDVPNSVTYLPEFVNAMKHLLRLNAEGIYNIVLKDALYYPDLLTLYQKYVPDYRFKVIPLRNLELVRTNLVMSARKLANSGFHVSSTKDILKKCVQRYVKS